MRRPRAIRFIAGALATTALVCFFFFGCHGLRTGSVAQTPNEDLSGDLSEEHKSDHHGDLYPKDPRLNTISELTEAATPGACDSLLGFLTTYGANRKLKQVALLALGKIGTEYAVNAVSVFEAWADSVSIHVLGFTFGPIDAGIEHLRRYDLKPLAKCEDEMGTEWAVFCWRRFPGRYLWLTSTRDGVVWSDPLLLDEEISRCVPEGSDLAVGADGAVFELSSGGKTVRFSVSEHLKDADRDGLTDAVERVIRTDPHDVDSDSDGKPDGEDGNPLTPARHMDDESARIRQTAFYVLFGTCNSRDAVLLVGDSPFTEQEYRGYAGPIIRSKEVRLSWVNVQKLDVGIVSDTSAFVVFRDMVDSLSASGRTIRLKKIHGRWVVMGFERSWIS